VGFKLEPVYKDELKILSLYKKVGCLNEIIKCLIPNKIIIIANTLEIGNRMEIILKKFLKKYNNNIPSIMKKKIENRISISPFKSFFSMLNRNLPSGEIIL
jgi:hypothetical protein